MGNAVTKCSYPWPIGVGRYFKGICIGIDTYGFSFIIYGPYPPIICSGVIPRIFIVTTEGPIDYFGPGPIGCRLCVIFSSWWMGHQLYFIFFSTKHWNPMIYRINWLPEARHSIKVVQQWFVGNGLLLINNDWLSRGKNSDGLLAEIEGPYPPVKSGLIGIRS